MTLNIPFKTMEHINTYEEDLQKVTSQIKELQEKQVALARAILKRDACNLIGDICDKMYHSENTDYFVIFRHVLQRTNPGFEYRGYAIKQNGGFHNFSVCNHQEVFTSKNDFDEKYELVDLNPECALYDLVETFKSVNYETSADD